MLLQSKELSDANSKLEATIDELETKLHEPETSPVPTMVNVKDATVTEATLEIDLPKQGLTDEDLLPLSGFGQIEEFILGENQLGNPSIKMLCNSFPQTKKLILDRNCFEASSLQDIGSMKYLKYLDIRDNKLGDECLQYVSSCKSLTDLSLSKNSLTDKSTQ